MKCSRLNEKHSNNLVSVDLFASFLVPWQPIEYFLVREFVPNVIEPSFGIGRILYALLEHSYWARKEDVDRGVSHLRTARPKRFSFRFGVILGSVLAALSCSDKGLDCPPERERGV